MIQFKMFKVKLKIKEWFICQVRQVHRIVFVTQDATPEGQSPAADVPWISDSFPNRAIAVDLDRPLQNGSLLKLWSLSSHAYDLHINVFACPLSGVHFSSRHTIVV